MAILIGVHTRTSSWPRLLTQDQRVEGSLCSGGQTARWLIQDHREVQCRTVRNMLTGYLCFYFWRFEVLQNRIGQVVDQDSTGTWYN
jgi:hypothetical protein